MHYLWVSIEKFGTVFLKVLGMVILARVLTPTDFGLFGMVYVIIALGQVLIDSGMGGALIKKDNANEQDYNTVFTFNLLVSLLIWLVLYFSSDTIASFYNENSLTDIIPLLSSVLVIRSLTIVPVTKLTKSLNFKIQSKLVLFSYVASFFVGYYFAVKEFGVYSLIIMSICDVSIFLILTMYVTKYKLKIGFNYTAFKGLYGFGMKISIASIIRTSYENILNIFIGKIYGTISLGFYYQARKINDVFISTTTNIINKAVFPILVKDLREGVTVKNKMRMLLNNICWLTYLFFVLLSINAEKIVFLIFGENWTESAWMLSIIVLSGFGMILEAATRCFLKSHGLASEILKLELKKRSVGIVIISLSAFGGIEIMLFAYVLSTLISSFFNMYAVSRNTSYGILEQLLDISKPLIFSILVYMFCEFTKYISHTSESMDYIYYLVLALSILTYIFAFYKLRLVSDNNFL
ncbi:putative O-antigen transporter [Vibrio chagasii]|nr:putative O-antigen transporter [Vibrio chagasii]